MPRRPGAEPRPRAGARAKKRTGTLIIRLSLYVIAVILFFVFRGRVDLGLLAHRVAPTPAATDTTLTLAGGDVAPLLIADLSRRYTDYYPHLKIETLPGTTIQALQDLVNRDADAAFLARPPSAADQAAFRKATGDTATWYPIALGALLVVGSPAYPDTSITLPELRERAFTEPAPGRRFYATDRNAGIWDAFATRLGAGGAAGPSGPEPHAYFLANEDSVIAYARDDRGALGLVSAFSLRQTLSGHGVRALSIPAHSDTIAARADNVTLATSAYPLWCYVYLACRRPGTMHGSTFLTYVTGPRGQRQIEATAYLPAKKILREVVITRPSTDE